MAESIEVSPENVSENLVDAKVETTPSLDRAAKTEKYTKVFRPEESIITLLKKDRKLKFIYSFIMAFLFWLVVESAVYDYYEYERVYFMTRTLKEAFNKFPSALQIWTIMQLIVLVLYFAFKQWSSFRKMLRNYSIMVRVWDYASLISFIVFQLAFLISGHCTVYLVKFNVGWAFALTMENVRFTMKMHSFVRTNAPIVLSEEKIDFSFRKYLYFLFAPTLLYKNRYPRTKTIRWRFVFVNVFEFFSSLFIVCYYYERHLKPTYHNLGEVKVSAIYLIKSFCFTTLTCSLMHFPFFYMLFQAWFNFFAELLQFADRRFYAEWWEVETPSEYFRKWNLVIQEWLYEFIYKELKHSGFTRSRAVLRYIVLFVSAIIHEIIIMSALRFFYPIIFVFMGIFSNVMFIVTPHLPKTIRPLLIWVNYNLGYSILGVSFIIEYRARVNCPTQGGWQGFLIPMSWSCILL